MKFLASLVATINAAQITELPPDSIKFVTLADIHLNPNYSADPTEKTYCEYRESGWQEASEVAHFGRLGCDTNTKLLDRMLELVK